MNLGLCQSCRRFIWKQPKADKTPGDRKLAENVHRRGDTYIGEGHAATKTFVAHIALRSGQEEFWRNWCHVFRTALSTYGKRCFRCFVEGDAQCFSDIRPHYILLQRSSAQFNSVLETGRHRCAGYTVSRKGRLVFVLSNMGDGWKKQHGICHRCQSSTENSN